MRINTNVSALNTQRQLGQTNSKVANSMARLSSGFRINKAADDAAGLSIANVLKRDIRSMEAASRNITEATSMVQIAEGAASSIMDILVRMKELATQAASANASTQGDTLQNEFSDLREELDRIVASTNYQGTSLIDGGFTGTFQVGAGGENDRITLTLGDSLAADTLGLDTAAPTQEALEDLDISDLEGAQAAMASLDTAVGQVNTALGTLGAYQNRLDYAQRNLGTAIQNYSASESAIRDVDMAKEMTELSKQQILQQAGPAMLAQANRASQGVLQLLQG